MVQIVTFVYKTFMKRQVCAPIFTVYLKDPRWKKSATPMVNFIVVHSTASLDATLKMS